MSARTSSTVTNVSVNQVLQAATAKLTSMNVHLIPVTMEASVWTLSMASAVTAPLATMTDFACQISMNVSVIHVLMEHARTVSVVLIVSVILVSREICVTDRLTTVRTTHVSTRRRVITILVTTFVSAHLAIKERTATRTSTSVALIPAFTGIAVTLSMITCVCVTRSTAAGTVTRSWIPALQTIVRIRLSVSR